MDLGHQEFNGNAISPVLLDGLKKYLINIDRTITEYEPK
jgi:hypothetical protein